MGISLSNISLYNNREEEENEAKTFSKKLAECLHHWLLQCLFV